MSETHTCATCNLSYLPRWCKEDKCTFCTRYMPMRDTRMHMLKDAGNCFTWSFWVDEAAFYKVHVPYLQAWCAHWHIPETAEEAAETEKLLKHRNWTREYWH